MVEKTVFKLRFLSPLHIGNGLGEAYDTTEGMLHSDTISGLLASAWCTLFNADNVSSFMNSYRVSSAFPYIADTYFLPRPAGELNLKLLDYDQAKANKLLKKIEFLSIDQWNTAACGQILKISRSNISNCGRFIFPDNKNSQSVFIDELEQRVSVPRAGSTPATPFYFERRFFSNDAGLYFFCDADNQTLNTIELLLKSIGTIGVGTDKSSGNGQFEVSKSTINISTVINETGYLLISLFCPNKEELQNIPLPNCRYQLIKRGGFIAGTTSDKFRHLRKRTIFMFTEGSYFSNIKPQGKIENVRPEWNDSTLHPVYRDGRAYFLPVKL